MPPKKQQFTHQQLRKLKKLAEVLDKGNVAVLEYLFEIEETIEKKTAEMDAKMEKKMPDLDNFLKAVKGKKGEKGDKGDKGDTGEKGDTIVGPAGKNGRDGKDGRDGTNGIDGRDGIDGKDGEDGVDGSLKEIAPQEVRDLLELLQDEERLSMDAIKDLNDTLKRLEEKIIVSNKGGGGVTNMRIQQAFKYILKTEAPVGSIDGVNLSYTVSQPIFAILSMSINGETIAQLPNYTISGKTFTFTTALPASYSGKDWEIKYI